MYTFVGIHLVYKACGIIFWIAAYFTYHPIELTTADMQKIQISAIVPDELHDDDDFGNIKYDHLYASIYSFDKLDKILVLR